MKILSVVGTRPNFMKVAPIIKALDPFAGRIEHVLVHTGQHYDERMSAAFFDDLAMPKPDHNLGIGGGSHAQQTGAVMMKIEPLLLEIKPDLVLVVGDVNSTLAATLTAKKLDMRVAHVEAGLRSFDMTMPEELNRLCTDAIADDLYTTDRLAGENLKREGVADERIHFVGNVMIDTLMAHRALAEQRSYFTHLGLEPSRYATLTLHRPSNVESAAKLAEIFDAIATALPAMPIIFPVHPRTRSRIAQFGFSDRFASKAGDPGIFLTEPLGYIDFLSLNGRAALVLTDSGGLQEETTILGVPCVTIRDNTERPITITEGTNRLAGTSKEGIVSAIAGALTDAGRGYRMPEKWDGQAAKRIVEIIAARLS